LKPKQLKQLNLKQIYVTKQNANNTSGKKKQLLQKYYVFSPNIDLILFNLWHKSAAVYLQESPTPMV